MSIKEIAFQVEEMAARMEVLHSTFTAITEAIFYGNNASSEYEWALYGVGDVIFHLKKEIEVMRDEAFAELKKGA